MVWESNFKLDIYDQKDKEILPRNFFTFHASAREACYSMLMDSEPNIWENFQNTPRDKLVEWYNIQHSKTRKVLKNDFRHVSIISQPFVNSLFGTGNLTKYELKIIRDSGENHYQQIKDLLKEKPENRYVRLRKNIKNLDSGK